jgi:hypothetical protein
MTTNSLLSELADQLREMAFDIELYSTRDDDFYPRGTVVKAAPNQDRFKPTSLWVSRGDGTYLHLTGKKNLIAKHSRLKDYVDVIFSA